MASSSFESFTRLHSSSLPVFERDGGVYRTYYAPGFLAVVPKSISAELTSHWIDPGRATHPVAAALALKARQAKSKWNELFRQPFKPESLNLYLHDRCNLDCNYCYSHPNLNKGTSLEPEFIRPAAEWVASNCARQGKPVTVVLHGGGEPSLDPRRLKIALEVIESVAARWGLGLFRYIATNGVMPASRAAWLAARFDLIGLSCDGPNSFQARQRPLHSGRSSTPAVERTARVLVEAGARFEVRVTVTPDSLRQQVEIARYLCERLKPSAIRVEAVYPNELKAPNGGFSLELTGEFVAHFQRARQVAHRYGVPWLSSASRPGEIHGPPCPLLLQALQIVPGGSASPCFKISAPGRGIAIGHLTGASSSSCEFAIDQHALDRLQAKMSVLSASCPECFNRFHCSRGCPDVCPVQGDAFLEGFRCQLAKKMMHASLTEIATRLWAKLDDKSGPAGCEVNLDMIA